MPRDLDSKCKRCRRAGEKLFLKGDRCTSPKCAMVKRNYPPGLHGSKGYQRITDFGQQLKTKQKIKQIYGMREKQFKNLFNKAYHKQGNTEDVFYNLLEMRFDNVIFRTGMAKSRTQAKQLISHGYYKLNDKNMNIPSHQIKVGDIITIKESKKDKKITEIIKQSLEKSEIPGWMSKENNDQSIKITGDPMSDAAKQPIDFKPIIEFYSR